MEPVYHKKRPKNVIEKRPRQVQYQFSRAENKSVAAADGSLGENNVPNCELTGRFCSLQYHAVNIDYLVTLGGKQMRSAAVINMNWIWEK